MTKRLDDTKTIEMELGDILKDVKNDLLYNTFFAEDEDFAEDEEPDDFDSPYNCDWVISVDCEHKVHILEYPNINPNFFAGGYEAELVGLPYDLPDVDAGVYKITCHLEEYRDWESGIIEDYEFILDGKMKPLWLKDNQLKLEF